MEKKLQSEAKIDSFEPTSPIIKEGRKPIRGKKLPGRQETKDYLLPKLLQVLKDGIGIEGDEKV